MSEWNLAQCCERGCTAPTAPWSRVRCEAHYTEPRYGGHAPISPGDQARVREAGRRRARKSAERRAEAARRDPERLAAGRAVRERRAAAMAAPDRERCIEPGCTEPVYVLKSGLCPRHYRADRYARDRAAAAARREATTTTITEERTA